MGVNQPPPWRRLWLVIALNCIGPGLLALFYGSYRLGRAWDSELLALLAVVIGSLSALVGGFVSLSQLRFFIETNRSSAGRSGLIVALMTLPLAIALSIPVATANPLEWYIERHFYQASDVLLIVSGTITYAIIAFAVGLISHRVATLKSGGYGRFVAAIVVGLAVAQVLLIILEASHAA